MDLINKIFYINLCDKVERNKHFLQQCEQHNIPMSKVERLRQLMELLTNLHL